MTAQRTQSPLLTTVLLSIALILTCQNGANARKEAINAISQSDIESIKNDINKTHTEISRIQGIIENNIKEKNDSIITRYNNDFNAFVAVCIGLFILFITLGVTVAITVGLYANDLIKKSRNATLELARNDLLEDIRASKNEILATAETSHFDIAARIYIMFSAHCINLYKDVDNLTPGTYKYNMYRGYLDIAVSMAKY